MKNKKTFNFRNKKEDTVEDSWEADERDYAESWEPNPKFRAMVKYGIMAMILIGCSIIWYNKKYGPVDTSYSESETRKKRILGKKYKEFSALVEKGDVALKSNEYFEAAYNYKQALSYYATNYELYEKLLAATEKSCEEGNNLHCKNIKGIQGRMEEVKRLMEE